MHVYKTILFSGANNKLDVVISKGETEDAVAALLGESFGISIDDYFECFNEDQTPVENEGELSSNNQTTDETVIQQN